MFPAFHVSGKSALYVSAAFGERLVVREQFSPQHFLDDIRKFEVTLAGLVGPMATWLMALPPANDDAETPLSKVYMGPIIPGIEDFKNRFGVKVATGFGMTEIGAPIASDGWDVSIPASCGKPRTDAYPGYEIRVVDEYDRPLGPGEVGELIVRSNAPWTLNAGYWGKPEQTAQAWRNGWFHTGDGFKYDEDGNFYFVDRMKDAIRRRGENISSFEVEALVNQHPAIQASAAVAVPDDAGSEDEVKVFVLLDPNVEGKPTLVQLHEHFAETMPKHMVPRYIEPIDALPQTEGTFRTRKVELRAMPAVGADTFDSAAS
jgi:crotonobetaine/carnitine-CoA ligase